MESQPSNSERISDDSIDGDSAELSMNDIAEDGESEGSDWQMSTAGLGRQDETKTVGTVEELLVI